MRPLFVVLTTLICLSYITPCEPTPLDMWHEQMRVLLNPGYGAYVKHVVIVVADGLRSKDLIRAPTPYIDRMVTSSQWTLQGRPGLQTVDLPGFMPVLYGASPEEAGVGARTTHNDAVHKMATFPSVFSVAKGAGMRTSAYTDTRNFTQFLRHGVVDHLNVTTSDRQTAHVAAADLTSFRPNVALVYFTELRDAEKKHGKGVQQYMDAVTTLDEHVGLILKAMGESDMVDETLLLITGGGGGYAPRPGDDPTSALLPWIAYGPSVKKGEKILKRPTTLNVAPTALYALGLEKPTQWIERPITEIIAATPSKVVPVVSGEPIDIK